MTNAERLTLADAADQIANEAEANPTDEFHGLQDALRERAAQMRAKAARLAA